MHRSMLLSKRNRDDEARAGFTKWPFMTTQSWAENPRGRWKLFVILDSEEPQAGSLHEWSLLLHGTRKSPYVGQKVRREPGYLRGGYWFNPPPQKKKKFDEKN